MTASPSANSAATHTAVGYSPKNSFHVPVHWLPCSSSFGLSATSPAANQLFAVSAGIPNHSNGISASPASR